MKRHAKFARLGTALASVLVVGGALAMVGCASNDVEGRTPIDVASLGPQVGERVPDFRLPDQHGELRTLESVQGPRGAMILFHRSADW